MSATISWPPAPCPECHAQVHEPCRGPSGGILTQPHAMRNREHKACATLDLLFGADPDHAFVNAKIVTPVDGLAAAQ